MFSLRVQSSVLENMSGSDGGIKTLANGLVICYLVVACTNMHTHTRTHTHAFTKRNRKSNTPQKKAKGKKEKRREKGKESAGQKESSIPESRNYSLPPPPPHPSFNCHGVCSHFRCAAAAAAAAFSDNFAENSISAREHAAQWTVHNMSNGKCTGYSAGKCIRSTCIWPAWNFTWVARGIFKVF